MQRVVAKKKKISELSKNAGYHLLKIYEVFNGESRIDRCNEHRWVKMLSKQNMPL
jgi:hypothetical protein